MEGCSVRGFEGGRGALGQRMGCVGGARRR